jgi:hypothetical protein
VSFNEAASHQRRPSDRHRQAVCDLVHLCRNTGPEIAITAVYHAPAGKSALEADRRGLLRS